VVGCPMAIPGRGLVYFQVGIGGGASLPLTYAKYEFLH